MPSLTPRDPSPDLDEIAHEYHRRMQEESDSEASNLRMEQESRAFIVNMERQARDLAMQPSQPQQAPSAGMTYVGGGGSGGLGSSGGTGGWGGRTSHPRICQQCGVLVPPHALHTHSPALTYSGGEVDGPDSPVRRRRVDEGLVGPSFAYTTSPNAPTLTRERLEAVLSDSFGPPKRKSQKEEVVQLVDVPVGEAWKNVDLDKKKVKG